ncbi:MAG: N-acetylneuraminate synthase family protein [Pseudomonadota bacterium]
MPNHFEQSFDLGGLEIGEGRPALVVAEIGGNAGRDMELALKMIDAAQKAGAAAVKFQAYRTSRFLARDSRYYDELAEEELSPEDLAAARAFAEARGLAFISSAFDFDSLACLARLDVAAVKIASGDIDNFPLLEAAAALGKPIILSTGASDLAETAAAVSFIKGLGVRKLVLLHCTTLYPCPDDQANLRSIPFLKERFNLPVGFSDHTLGIEAPLAALALGAVLIEKHFTVDRGLPGGDNSMSCLPDELAALARGAHRIDRMLGGFAKVPSPGESEMRTAIRRSLAAGRDIKAGETFSRENIDFKRPAQGLRPEDFYRLKGRRAGKNIRADEFITWDMVE